MYLYKAISKMDYSGVKASRLMGFAVQSPKIELKIMLSISEMMLLSFFGVFCKAELDASCEKLHFNDEIRVLTFCNCCCCSYHWFPFWDLRRKSTKNFEKLASFLMSQITTQLVLIFDETENICVDSEQKLTRFDGNSLTLFTISRNLDF